MQSIAPRHTHASIPTRNQAAYRPALKLNTGRIPARNAHTSQERRPQDARYLFDRAVQSLHEWNRTKTALPAPSTPMQLPPPATAPDSPTSIYSQDVDGRQGASAEAPQGQRDSLQTIRPPCTTSLETVRPAQGAGNSAFPSDVSFDVAYGRLMCAEDASVVCDAALQYTLPQLQKHPTDRARQAQIAAEHMSQLQRSIADPQKMAIINIGFLEAYQVILQTLGAANEGSRPSTSSGETDGERASLTESRTSKTKISSWFRRADPKDRKLARSISSLSLHHNSEHALRSSKPSSKWWRRPGAADPSPGADT